MSEEQNRWRIRSTPHRFFTLKPQLTARLYWKILMNAEFSGVLINAKDFLA